MKGHRYVYDGRGLHKVRAGPHSTTASGVVIGCWKSSWEYWTPIPMVSAKKDQQDIQGKLERSQMGGVERTGQREVESLLLFSFIHRGLSRDEERKRDRSMRLGRPAKMIDKSRFTPTIPAHSLGWFAAVCRKDSVLPAHNRSALKIPIVVVTTRRRHDIFTSDTQLPRFGRVRR